MEATKATYREMAGAASGLPGGDYGFAWIPAGAMCATSSTSSSCSAIQPTEALLSATKVGGELMALGDELGKGKAISPNCGAESGPARRLVQHRDRLAMIMKDGALHKLDLASAGRPDRRGIADTACALASRGARRLPRQRTRAAVSAQRTYHLFGERSGSMQNVPRAIRIEVERPDHGRLAGIGAGPVLGVRLRPEP